MEAVVPPLGVCELGSLATLFPMLGNWMFTATRSGRPVGEKGGASIAWWTPDRGSGKGYRVEICERGALGWSEMYTAEDAVELRWQHVCIC